MRRIILSFLLALVSVMSGFAQNNAMYVYRNDGEFNAFLKCDVDSMRYSRLDLDSIFHDEWQMQEIFTPDSVYRIPLTAIDSISFVTPEPVYKQDVHQASDDLLKYIVSYTETTLTLLNSTPAYLLPKVGEVFVSEQYEAPLPNGFAGRLLAKEQTTEGIVCRFEEVGIGDIFSQLVMVGKAETVYDEEGNVSQRRISKAGRGTVSLPASIPLETSWNNIMEEEEGKIDGKASITLDHPKITIDYAICWLDKGLANALMVIVTLESKIKENYTLKVGGTCEPEPHMLVKPFPVRVGPISGEVGFGLYFEAAGEAEITYSENTEFRKTVGFNWNENTGPISIASRQKNDYCRSDGPQTELSLNGSLGMGAVLDLNLGIIHRNVASLDALVKFGPEVDAKLQLASSESGWNTSLYKMLKEAEIATRLRLKVEPRYRVFGDKPHKFGVSASVTFAEDSRRIIPSFSNLLWRPEGTNSGNLYANITNDVFLPVQIGWTLHEKDGKRLPTVYFPDSYLKFDKWNNPTLKYTLSDLPTNYNYKAYPTIKLWKFEIPCDEYVEVSSQATACAHVTDFKVTKSYHKDGGYISNGQAYDYKFEVATTVDLDDNDPASLYDWGYVYEDPDGKISHISLKDYASLHTDTRYAYYRNSASSTARLYGYVRYSSDGEYYYDTPRNYPLVHKEEEHHCPDGNHPHLIDLGLPSGTKWACCNVGAHAPEEYGDYFAWGETQPKSTYNWSTYKWMKAGYSDWKGCSKYTAKDGQTSGCWYSNGTFVGDNKTELDPEDDAAYVNWGNGWRMPSVDQQYELCTECTWTWDDSKKGYNVLGPNGGSLFLPAAGYYIGSSLWGAGVIGLYWLRSLNLSYSYSAYYVYFRSGGVGADRRRDSRYRGQSVRPVRQN